MDCEVFFARFGRDKASVVAEEHGGVGVAKVGCGGGCVLCEFVVVRCVAVAHDVIGPCDSRSLNKCADAFFKAIVGEAEGDAAFVDGVRCKDGSKIVGNGDGACRVGLGVRF